MWAPIPHQYSAIAYFALLSTLTHNPIGIKKVSHLHTSAYRESQFSFLQQGKPFKWCELKLLTVSAFLTASFFAHSRQSDRPLYLFG
jgi:hypothetical protein